MNDIPVNCPYECTNHTTDDNAASLSRVCGSCDQVKNEQLQCGGLKSTSTETFLSNSFFFIIGNAFFRLQ